MPKCAICSEVNLIEYYFLIGIKCSFQSPKIRELQDYEKFCGSGPTDKVNNHI